MPKALGEQVVVITGASSGIGRVTARMLAEHDARVVAGARNIDALNELVHEISRKNKYAIAVKTDVSSQEQVEHLAHTALERFGRIDTWVNNAGASVYATFDKLTDEEIRRVLDVDFMGTVYGMQAALSAMRPQDSGTIINIASVAGKRGLPLQSVYSAAKYAVVGLGEAVRAELAHAGSHIAVCTICPPAINTSFFDHARTKEGYAPKPLPPVYEPETVASAILACAVHPRREVLTGSAAKGFTLLNTVAPGLMDWALGQLGVSGQLTAEPKSAEAPTTLFTASTRPQDRADWTTWGTRQHRFHTTTADIMPRNPLTAIVGLAAALLVTRYLTKATEREEKSIFVQ